MIQFIQGDFYRESLAPSIFLASKLLRHLPRGRVALAVENSSSRVPLPVTHSNTYARIAIDVLYPLRFTKMLGQYVELVVERYKPYLDLARLTAHSPGRGHVDELKF